MPVSQGRMKTVWKGGWKWGMGEEIPSCLVTDFLSITVEIWIWVLFPEYVEMQFLDFKGDPLLII